jgi:SAM-dependent methyltransferase
MGISSHIFRSILKEHAHRPLAGKGLLIGRQSVFFTQDNMRAIAASENVPLKDIQLSKDTETRAGGEITDYELFTSFCDLEMDALDVTDYENANIVHDMHYPVPAALHNQYDFIYNGSCMDNLFNPAEFLKNCSRMLKSGGRILSIEHGSAYPGGYLLYSPDFFLDFFAINNYADALVLVCDFLGNRSPHHIQSPWTLWRWNPLLHGKANEHSMHLSLSNRLILSIAEKSVDSTNERIPIQGQYRTSEGLNEPVYEQSYQRFLKSSRVSGYKSPQPVDWALSQAVSNLEFVGVL